MKNANQIEKGLINYTTGKYREAIAFFDYYIQSINHNDPTAYYYRGQSKRQLMDLEGYASDFDTYKKLSKS